MIVHLVKRAVSSADGGPFCTEIAFLRPEDAHDYMEHHEGVGWQNKQLNRRVSSLFVWEGSWVEAQRSEAALRESGLAKLTAAERQALGL